MNAFPQDVVNTKYYLITDTTSPTVLETASSIAMFFTAM